MHKRCVCSTEYGGTGTLNYTALESNPDHDGVSYKVSYIDLSTGRFPSLASMPSHFSCQLCGATVPSKPEPFIWRRATPHPWTQSNRLGRHTLEMAKHVILGGRSALRHNQSSLESRRIDTDKTATPDDSNQMISGLKLHLLHLTLGGTFQPGLQVPELLRAF